MARPDARYVLLTTYRRDGTGVAAPAWFAPAGQQLLVRTDARSAKVRRMRRDHRICVCICTARGCPTSKPAQATQVYGGAGASRSNSPLTVSTVDEPG